MLRVWLAIALPAWLQAVGLLAPHKFCELANVFQYVHILCKPIQVLSLVSIACYIEVKKNSIDIII